MTNQRTRWIDEIASFPAQLRERVASLSEKDLGARPLEDEWSVAQIVHHLVDSHINSYVRCKLMATESHPTFRPYDESAWGELADARSTDIETSLRLLDALHQRWVHFWQNLSDGDWGRTGFHPEGETTVTLEDQLRLYVEHGRAHMEQIDRTLEASGVLKRR